MNQTDFGIAAGVSRGTQKAYELESSSPDLRYLGTVQGLGVDVHYVLTGSRHTMDAGKLSEEETTLLGQFRALPENDRSAVKRLTGALAATSQIK